MERVGPMRRFEKPMRKETSRENSPSTGEHPHESCISSFRPTQQTAQRETGETLRNQEGRWKSQELGRPLNPSSG